MKRYYYSYIISILVHAIVITILYFVLSGVKLQNSNHQIAIPLQVQHKNSAELFPNNRKKNNIRSSKTKVIENLKHNTDKISLSRKPEFNKIIIPHRQIKNNKSLLFNLPNSIKLKENKIFPFLSDSIKNFVNPADEIAKNLLKSDNNETFSSVSVSGLITNLLKVIKKKNTKAVFDFIPTQDQTKALKILTQRENSTQIGLYKSLDFDHPVTAEQFNKELSILVDKGFLKRKKISPQLIFNFFGVPVEMSKKNIQNPVYQYSSRVSRSQIITYLQAQLFLMQDKLTHTKTDTTKIKKKIMDLKKKIMVMIQ